MAAAAPAPPTLSLSHPNVDDEDSGLSSPLSEVDDKDEDPDDLDSITLDHPEPRGDQSDSDSVLSDTNDTDAETERLYDTPRVTRHKTLVLDDVVEEDVVDTTPSKPSTAVVGVVVHDPDDSLSDVDMSAPPSSPPDEPVSPTKATRSLSTEENSSTEAKKRKRSPVADRFTAVPLRKRTGSIGVPIQEPVDKNASIDIGGNDKETKSLQSPAGVSPGEGGESTEGAQREDSPIPEPVISKKMTRNGSKQAKAAMANGIDNEDRDGPTEDDARGRRDEGMEADAEEDLDAAARHDEEEAERKRVAIEEWTGIEEKFSVFRDRLYKDRLEKLEREERALTADVPYHTEYLNMKQCIDELHEEKLRKINKEYEFTIAANDEVAVSRRAMIWGQFYQGVREMREKMLSELNCEWHDTQNARRHAHSAPDYALVYPTTPAQRVRNAVAYNTEVSILSGVAKYVGFPSAPLMHGASATELEEDLDTIKRTRRHQRQHPTIQHHSAHPGTLDSAGEQFIQNTPWANPNHPHHRPQKPSAGPSSENQADAQTRPVRVNGQQTAVQAGPQRPRHRVESMSPEASRASAILSQEHMKRMRSLEGASGATAKTSHEQSTVKQGLLGASSGS